MRKPIAKALHELVKDQILTQDKADEIRAYYAHKNDQAPNRLVIVFGILGALLIGLGIILILAHNWDDLSRSTKTVLAFIPLLVGQVAGAYTLWKQKDSIAWREGSGTFLFFAIGACISLISQIYHVSGSMSGFVLTWMLLALPMVYVLRTSAVSIFYLVGITYYACEVGYWQWFTEIPWVYGLLLLMILPHYYLLYKNRGGSNFTGFHHWLIPLSCILTLGTIDTDHTRWIVIAYMSLFGLLYIIGSSRYFKQHPMMFNGPAILGGFGTAFMLILTSFRGFWEDFINGDKSLLADGPFVPEFLTAVLISLGALTLFGILHRRRDTWEPSPMTWVFVIFLPVFFLGASNPFWGTLFINIMAFLVGLFYIRKGARDRHLGILNFGLLLISILIGCRFFDTNISFVLRGLIFVALGAGFFAANYFIIKKKNTNAIKS